MKLQVITQTRSRSGKPMQAKKTVNADWIRVGRAANSEIHLADPRIALNQGLIMDRGGLVYTEGEAGIVSQASTTRKAVRSVRMTVGKFVDVGPYKITAVAAPEGYDAAITIELMRPAEATGEDLAARARKLNLASLHLPKRWAAWAFFIVIGIVFFALPAGRVLNLPWDMQTQKIVMASDKFWNPGPVLLAHQPIEMKCAACHEVAFHRVKDGACLECHQKIGHHVGPEMMPAALFEGDRCTSCHLDHKGVKPTHRDNDTFCVDCHKDIRPKASTSTSLNVSDFAKDHPAFRLTLPQDKGTRRVRMGSGPIGEQSNLIFPHDVHLDPKGVRSPERGRITLDCASCHAPDASKRTFEPVSMKKHCQECHRLEFEPAVTTREVPHGAARDALLVVEEFYGNLALNGVKDSFEKAFGVPGEGLLRRVGEPSEDQRKVALGLAKSKAAKVSQEMFEVRVCKTCHEISRTEEGGNVDWKVAAVRANNAWMPMARFDHKSHETAKCSDCHNVSKSKLSADVAMPAIESCRDCHGGSKPVEKKITSNCLMCHGFHEQKHPWDPNFKPKAATRVAEGRPNAN